MGGWGGGWGRVTAGRFGALAGGRWEVWLGGGVGRGKAVVWSECSAGVCLLAQSIASASSVVVPGCRGHDLHLLPHPLAHTRSST